MDLSGNNYLFVFWVCWPGLAPAGDLLSCPRKKGGKESVLRSFGTVELATRPLGAALGQPR
jgi:uncharacterized membrane-anchored protein